MNSGNRQHFTWVPLALAASLIVGIMIGSHFTTQKSSEFDRKLNNILNIVANDYVDNVNIDSLIDMSIPSILGNLDPHSVYFTPKDLLAANEELEGSFCGIGIEFQILDDTINVVQVIAGGPSDKQNIMNGDKIISVDGKPFVGKGFTPSEVREKLRGEKGSVVKLGIKRGNSKKHIFVNVTRGEIPITSVDATYMIDKNTGYIKVNQFGRNTYVEFRKSLDELRTQGSKRFIIDLRGNGGGYMEMAIRMANEFLPANQLIVSTKGRYKRDDSQVWSDGTGSYQEVELIVLIDEFSASASEIFAGAMQDNDRGLIVGCRSFGKGLVQKQFPLPDNSAIRLTIARYYTPSGRCIQKEYKSGGLYSYDMELQDRLQRGEYYSRDSIKLDKSKMFTTTHGRTVYGGGGIIPDIFVPLDSVSGYYMSIVNAGLPQQYAMKYVQNNKKALKATKDYKQLLRQLADNDNLLNSFVDYASSQGIPARWYYINQSKDQIITILKALIARNLLGQKAYYPILNRTDHTIEAALKALNKHQATFPITATGMH